MIVLDTNVFSELMRAQPDAAVLAWLDAQPSDALSVTAITVAEVLYGITRLPEGKRKSALHLAACEAFTEDFGGKILAFDEFAAEHYAELVAVRERCGQPISIADAQIAAICKSNGVTALATRNVKDFLNLGLDLVNPWERP